MPHAHTKARDTDMQHKYTTYVANVAKVWHHAHNYYRCVAR